MALVVLCAGMPMIVLDVTVVNVALPSIQDDLGFSQSSLAWVVNAYLIAARRLSRRPRRLHARLDGVRPGPEAGDARRRAASAGRWPRAVILGMIVTMFPEPAEQAKAMGVYAFVASAGGAVGLLVGGA